MRTQFLQDASGVEFEALKKLVRGEEVVVGFFSYKMECMFPKR